jgi:DNA-3-methyladenine glycosylase
MAHEGRRHQRLAPHEAAAVPAEGAARLSERRLPRSFYDRPSVEVAPDLLGRTLVRVLPDGTRLSGSLVETEAYEPGDPASHGFRRKGLRNATMFGGPGRLYVYFTYGHHWMMNAVCRPIDVPSAVLLRAVRPVEGLEEMALRRGRDRDVDLASGPGKLCQALGVDGSHDGEDLVHGRTVWIEAGSPPDPGDIAVGIRVGVSVGMDKEWRFRVADDPFVSKGRPGPPR